MEEFRFMSRDRLVAAAAAAGSCWGIRTGKDTADSSNS